MARAMSHTPAPGDQVGRSLLVRDAVAEPGEGQRVAVVDAHVAGVEKLEVDHVAGYADVPP